MAEVTKSATGVKGTWGKMGDDKSHIFKIDPTATINTVSDVYKNAKGKPISTNYITVDYACGKCHDAAMGSSYVGVALSQARARAVAVGMHDAAAVTYATTFTTSMTGLTVNVTAYVNCGDGIVCPAFTYDWDWGDTTSTLGGGQSDSHPYTSYAAKKIGLTVRLGGKVAGTASRSVTPAPPTTTFTAITTGLKVDVVASASCGGPCPIFAYDWNWGDGSAHGTANPDTHTYAAPGGTKTITLTLSEGGKTLAMVAKNVKPTSAVADLAPVASATCTWNADTWTATVLDTSTDTDLTKVQTVTVDWGDKTSRSVATYYGGDLDPRATLTHTYLAPPKGSSCVGGGNAGAACTVVSQCPGGTCTANTSYPTVLTAIDSALKASAPVTLTCSATVAPAYFTIDGSVTGPGGTPGLSAASVNVKRQTCLGGSNGGASCTVASQCPLGSCAANTVKTVYTLPGGTFSAGSLKPGNYTLTVKKTGYTFTDPAAAITVGPSGSVGIISAN